LTPKKGSASFTKDMQTMYFAAEYYGLGYGRYDIYRVKRTPKGWSAPINLGTNINTDFWESAPSISIDGNALYFCSNRPDGYGGIDIYVSYKNEDGYWEEAENLGPDINTEGDEQTPFIHGDNKTLFFASNGWPGYGGSDLFVSKKENGSWSKPINLGYPINTYDNEGSITVQSNGVDAYIASDRADSRGGLDIYKVLLAKNTRANWKDTTPPKPVIAQVPVIVPEIKIIPNKPQIFNNLLFALNSAELINKDAPELNAIVNYLKNNLIAKIIVEGHTDNTGTAANNLILSTQRAKTIQQYLVDKGIALNRITSIGYGDTKPIADNKTEQGRATNRRTSFTIILPLQK
jgi:outer membrane protein OmpA-like peptidoglycan-associated protein